MSAIVDAGNVWLLAVLAAATVTRLILKDRIAMRMFTKAIENSTPAERPKIIQAMRGLIGQNPPSRAPDEE